MIRRDPIGVVGSIAPGTIPDAGSLKLAPVLAGGNTIVIKPSEQTPPTTLKLAKTIAEIFPEGGEYRHWLRRNDRPHPHQSPENRHGVADRTLHVRN
jgi:acyl-CoA reductase-like NAD-dependent aldehyde dehydrogenase